MDNYFDDKNFWLIKPRQFPDITKAGISIMRRILCILSFARQTYPQQKKGVFDMKATGIVRRIDDYVIIRDKVGKP